MASSELVIWPTRGAAIAIDEVPLLRALEYATKFCANDTFEPPIVTAASEERVRTIVILLRRLIVFSLSIGGDGRLTPHGNAGGTRDTK
jgi:hypothetical protein